MKEKEKEKEKPSKLEMEYAKTIHCHLAYLIVCRVHHMKC